MSSRPFPLPSDLGLKPVRPSTHIYRAAVAHLRSFLSGASPASVARSLWPDDRTTQLVLRAATGPAEVFGSSDWAASLGGIAVYDLIHEAATVSAAAALIDRGLQLSMDGIAEYRLPGRLLDSAAAQWVPEGLVAPIRQLSFSNASLLHPRKLRAGYAYSREQAEHTNIEAVLRQTLQESIGLGLDLQMLSANAGDTTRPPGLFVNSDVLTAVAGGGVSAMDGDLKSLFGALAAHNAGKTAVIIAAVPQAIFLKANLGPKWDIDILTSTKLAAGTVGVVEVGSFVSGFSSVVEFKTRKEASAHFEDTAATDITGGTPSPAVPVKSFYQLDLIGLDAALWGGWGLRGIKHAHWVQNTTW